MQNSPVLPCLVCGLYSLSFDGIVCVCDVPPLPPPVPNLFPNRPTAISIVASVVDSYRKRKNTSHDVGGGMTLGATAVLSSSVGELPTPSSQITYPNSNFNCRKYRALAYERYKSKKQKRTHIQHELMHGFPNQKSSLFSDLSPHPLLLFPDAGSLASSSSAPGPSLSTSKTLLYSSPSQFRRRPNRRRPKGRALLLQIAVSTVMLPLASSCRHCHAVKFFHESVNFCCSDGNVALSTSVSPPTLITLLTDPSTAGVSFRECIRTYNNHLAFTSLGVTADKSLQRRNCGIYTFKVQGQIYHFLNSLNPSDASVSNAQLYFYDTNYETDLRLQNCERLVETTLTILLALLVVNPYAKFFRNLRNLPKNPNRQLYLHGNPSVDQKVLNRPTVDQVSAILEQNPSDVPLCNRDIRAYTHSSVSHPISYFYGCYDPLQYPLLFPNGEVGWHQGIKKTGLRPYIPSGRAYIRTPLPSNPAAALTASALLESEQNALNASTDNRSCVSVKEYYAYKFQIRPFDNSYLLSFGRLFQQYAVDMYIKLETQRLDYYTSQQKEIRQEFLQGVIDAVAAGESDSSQIGSRIVLPANFTGGPRHMHRKYMDAMALVQKFGRPDFFITVTCNPNWPEISELLLPTEEAQNRPDLLVRVFKAKFEVLKKELVQKSCFGEVQAYTYVIEYQKRGLPHAHILLIVKPAFKIYRPEEYDSIVSAEIPDANLHPYLYSLVVKHMLHGPCGVQNPTNVCMLEDGSCRNYFPKKFQPVTTQASDAYPTYRRRDNGVRVIVRGHSLDNRWVVPYSPYLLSQLDCHINVEVCSNVKAVKYIYKYICKGHDRISYQVIDSTERRSVNEISDFQSARWVSAPEALWRIFRFPIGDMMPSVIRLPLHLENFQPITFNKNQRLRNVLATTLQRQTMLTEFFHTNNTCPQAKTLSLTYNEFPDHFVWVDTDRQWKLRQRNTSVGRLVTVHPTDGERYFLRILLRKVRCPVSYTDLRTYNGVLSPTFRAAALARGFLENDNTQESCLREACLFHMPYELRRLFSTLLVHACPSDPMKLWTLFEPNMSEDFRRDRLLTPTGIRMKVLQQLNNFLQSMGKDISSFGILPSGFHLNVVAPLTRELDDERSIQVSSSDLHSTKFLNASQLRIFHKVLDRISNNEPGAFFVDGPGGTGKSFLYRALLADVRSKGNIALATASSGIAASILPGGRTAHSRFKIPIDLSNGSTCRVSKQSGLALLIIQCKLIIWDEAPMCNRDSIQALDNLLRDLMSSEVVFGGKVIVLGGDFRQTLPVVRNGSKNDTLAACLKSSHLWPKLEKLSLTENMRALTDPAFTAYLLNVGNGTSQNQDSESIEIPSSILLPSYDENTSLDKLILSVYPDFTDFSAPATRNRVILTTKNSFVEEINSLLITNFPGSPTEYLSYDRVLDDSNEGQYEDLINTLTPNGLPPHNLVLKLHAPIMLLRNVNALEGLCNGTRLTCLAFDSNLIKAEISFGDFKGKVVFIHRIPMRPSTDDNYPVPYTRTQFPIRLCFAMTINKSQGQTLDTVGVYLKEPVFSHGQLYVALSRAKSSSNIYVLIKPAFCDPTTSNRTLNVVYKEVLSDILDIPL